MTTFVRRALMIEIGQLQAKQTNISTSKILKLTFANITIIFLQTLLLMYYQAKKIRIYPLISQRFSGIKGMIIFCANKTESFNFKN